MKIERRYCSQYRFEEGRTLNEYLRSYIKDMHGMMPKHSMPTSSVTDRICILLSRKKEPDTTSRVLTYFYSKKTKRLELSAQPKRLGLNFTSLHLCKPLLIALQPSAHLARPTCSQPHPRDGNPLPPPKHCLRRLPLLRDALLAPPARHPALGRLLGGPAPERVLLRLRAEPRVGACPGASRREGRRAAAAARDTHPFAHLGLLAVKGRKGR